MPRQNKKNLFRAPLVAAAVGVVAAVLWFFGGELRPWFHGYLAATAGTLGLAGLLLLASRLRWRQVSAACAHRSEVGGTVVLLCSSAVLAALTVISLVRIETLTHTAGRDFLFGGVWLLVVCAGVLPLGLALHRGPKRSPFRPLAKDLAVPLVIATAGLVVFPLIPGPLAQEIKSFFFLLPLAACVLFFAGLVFPKLKLLAVAEGWHESVAIGRVGRKLPWGLPALGTLVLFVGEIYLSVWLGRFLAWDVVLLGMPEMLPGAVAALLLLWPAMYAAHALYPSWEATFRAGLAWGGPALSVTCLALLLTLGGAAFIESPLGPYVLAPLLLGATLVWMGNNDESPVATLSGLFSLVLALTLFLL